ncbi:hypothetical protein [Actinomadura sp. HBU206391]|uniref:hypothetical protein n=1 Tax=Actinomadura sp. HBU206391 TaxID=2731692 RepID=UPI00164F5EC5|nr:hypothetical protein [Actinomadura sp. HBU206391]MBC6461759.1 hypothetical protein [Actinomadura sp. HBU206391]
MTEPETTRSADGRAAEPAAVSERPPARSGGDAEASADGPESVADARAPGLLQLPQILGAVVAPTTLLSSLLYYFGWSHAYWFFDYFGVNSTLLGLTTSDYLMRSLDALFVPMTVVASAALLALWGHAVLRARLAVGSRPRLMRVVQPAVGIGGLALAIGGLASVVATTVLSAHLAVAPLSLASGVLLLTYWVHLRRVLTARPAGRERRPAGAAAREWAVVFLLVGLSLFWAASDYAAAVGTQRARQFVAELPTYPSAVIYSERSLSLHAPGVREVRCDAPAAAYRFRYDGLTLVLQSGDQYLFLPRAWTPSDGLAVIVARDKSLRLEFIRPSARATLRSTC